MRWGVLLVVLCAASDSISFETQKGQEFLFFLFLPPAQRGGFPHSCGPVQCRALRSARIWQVKGAQMETHYHERRGQLQGPSAGGRVVHSDNSDRDFSSVSAPRVLDYRADSLPIEKAVALTVHFTPPSPNSHTNTQESWCVSSLALSESVSRQGALSYKESYAAIKAGRITINGQPAVVDDFARRADALTLDGAPLPPRQPVVYYLLYKPAGVLTSTEVGANACPGELRKAEEGGTVLQFVPPAPRVVPVGRLDLDSEGLILLTNHGSLVHMVTSPAYRLDKTYAVLVERFGRPGGAPPEPEALRRLVDPGVVLQNGEVLTCLRAALRAEAPRTDVPPLAGRGGGGGGAARRLFWLEVVLDEGRNRHVRKLVQGLGYHVRRLVRTRVGPIEARATAEGAEGGWSLAREVALRPGEWRALRAEEVDALLELHALRAPAPPGR